MVEDVDMVPGLGYSNSLRKVGPAGGGVQKYPIVRVSHHTVPFALEYAFLEGVLQCAFLECSLRDARWA